MGITPPANWPVYNCTVDELISGITDNRTEPGTWPEVGCPVDFHPPPEMITGFLDETAIRDSNHPKINAPSRIALRPVIRDQAVRNKKFHSTRTA